MVIYHVILIAVVIEGDGRFSVVRGVDVDLSVEVMGGGVGGVDVRDQGFVHGCDSCDEVLCQWVGDGNPMLCSVVSRSDVGGCF